MFAFIFILYTSLILKGFISFSRLEKVVRIFPELIGKLEYFISPLRDHLIAYFLGFLGAYHLFFIPNLKIAIFYLGAFLLSQINWYYRKKFRLNFCRWVLKFGEIEPNFFFKTYYRGLGSFLNQLPTSAPTVSYATLDYSTGRPSRLTYIPLLIGISDTLTLAKLAVLAMKKLPRLEGINAFDAFARLWGSRFVAVARLKVTTLGVEKLPHLDGKVLLIFNHKSYLDFALNFFALGEIRNGSRHLRPRFIAAKDHFIDNPFIYSWLGIGKCVEKAGMIFINRKKGKGWLAMQEASKKLIHEEVEVAVYPQGTRAWAMFDEKGNRRDAGYYTTYTEKNLSDCQGHLKIGSAQAILDTALSLREKNEKPLTVLFIGINGTATVGPKKSFLIQTESEVVFRIGECWKVELPDNVAIENPRGRTAATDAERNYLEMLDRFQTHIDVELEKTIGQNEALTESFFSAVDSFLGEENLNQKKREIKEFLSSANRNHSTLPFMILDRIYTLSADRWKNYLERVQELILSKADREKWQELNEEVSRELLKER